MLYYYSIHLYFAYYPKKYKVYIFHILNVNSHYIESSSVSFLGCGFLVCM